MLIQLSEQELELLQSKAKLACIPKTGKGIVNRARKEAWTSILIKGKGGRGGTKRLYTLPEYVVAELTERNLTHYAEAIRLTSQHVDLGEKSQQPLNFIKKDLTHYLEPIHLISQHASPEVRKSGQSLGIKRVELFKEAHASFKNSYESWMNQQSPKDIIPIRYYKNIWINAGYKFLTFEHTLDVMWFQHSFIKNHLRVQPESCICAQVKGDSMSPTIKPDGTVLIELNPDYLGEGIYLIRQGSELILKRLQKVTSDVVRIISDNHHIYPPVDLDISTLPESEFAILGRYVWDAGVAR